MNLQPFNLILSDELKESYIRPTIRAHPTPEVTIARPGGPTLMGIGSAAENPQGVTVG